VNPQPTQVNNVCESLRHCSWHPVCVVLGQLTFDFNRHSRVCLLWPSRRAPQPGTDCEISIGGEERRQTQKHITCVQRERWVAGWKISRPILMVILCKSHRCSWSRLRAVQRLPLAAIFVLDANRNKGRTQGVLGVKSLCASGSRQS
jgi:hypothetical protein